MRWTFKPNMSDTVTEPYQDSFFSQDILGETPGRAMVREGIQNALDQVDNRNAPVKVRIAVFSNLAPEAKKLVSDPHLWKHIQADENGLDASDTRKPASSKKCPYLVFEDFNTSGLTGDTEQARPKTGSPNHFFNFFRAAGGTGKESGQGGSWGLGKHTFWMASRIRTAIGYTVRKGESHPMLMGKIILKSHAIDGGKEQEYQEGFYSAREGKDGIPTPIIGNDAKELATVLRLKRNSNTGLSIIVPYLNSDVTRDDILGAVIKDYFYPILTNKLCVLVEDDKGKIEIDGSNIKRYAKNFPLVSQHIDLCNALINARKTSITKIWANKMDSPKWEREMFRDVLATLCKDYRDGNPICLRAYCAVTPPDKPSIHSHFDIALVRPKAEEGISSPVVVRNDINIPNAGKRSNALSLVVIEHKPLAELLRQSENPSHTEWQHALIKDSYKFAKTFVSFVSQSADSIARLLTQEDTERDEFILADLFPTGLGSSMQPPPEPIPQYILIHKTSTGFTVRKNPKKLVQPGWQLEVKVAYGVRNGSPLSNYSSEDFVLKKTSIVKKSGMMIDDVRENFVKATIQDPNFALQVDGFGGNRDLYVKAEVAPLPDNNTNDTDT